VTKETGVFDAPTIYGMGPDMTVADLDVDPSTNTVGARLLAMMDATYAQGNTRDSARLRRFIAQGRKLILYHGASDPLIATSQSIAFYQELIRQQQGIERTQKNVRLFLVQCQFPSVTVSFNLAGGGSLGDAVTAVQQAEVEPGVPSTLTGSFQGTAQAFQASLSTTEPYDPTG
jgi:hypothetical protein